MITEQEFKNWYFSLDFGERMDIFNQYCSEYGSSDDAVYSFDEEFFENMFDSKEEVCRATCYGDVNYTDPYIQLNAYGNLVSLTKLEAEAHVDWYVEQIYDYPDIWESYFNN